MGLSKTIWSKPSEYIAHKAPAHPVLFFAPGVLQDTARRFIDGFPGVVTYAVKANPMEMVLENLTAAGMRGFAVASPAEMQLVHRLAPEAAMHSNTPVRTRAEIRLAAALKVKSYAVDSRSELDKLIELVAADGIEISVRFALPATAPRRSAKFGAEPDLAAELLQRAAAAGFTPSLSFHPGTQCADPAIWSAHILAARQIADAAGVPIARLNVGGGFPGHRLNGKRPDLPGIFAAIRDAAAQAFGDAPPVLMCEPGRGMVAESFSLAAGVRAVRDGADIFLNDGTYGTLDELPVIGLTDRVQVLQPDGTLRTGALSPRIVFGPTCDSIDRLPGELPLPADIAEGDFVVFHGLGAYSITTNTRFNGFGNVAVETVLWLA